MDKLHITIRDRSYTLRTDECPERISQIAANLDEKLEGFMQAMRGRPEYEILTIAAFDLMEQADNAEAEVARLQSLLEESERSQSCYSSVNDEFTKIAEIKEQENNELRTRISEFERQWDAYTAKTHASATDEFMHIAEAKEREISELRLKLLEYEKTWDDCVNKFKNEAGDEFAQIAAVREKENSELIARFLESEKDWNRYVIELFESAIAEYKEVVEANESENQKLSETLENFERTFADFASTKENEIIRLQEEVQELKLRLADLSEDGQMTLM
jgi:cell division protein ZapA (FtsZ GTPase activity inhibitor)